MGEIFGAIGSVAAAGIQASAIKDATDAQIAALERQRQYVYQNLDPSVIGPQATQADILRAQNRLALQGQIDPALLQERYAAETATQNQLAGLGQGSPADLVAKTAAGEAVTGTPGLNEAKQKLIDAALTDLKSGATLPPDVQAELVKAGLERSGMTTGRASGQGVGGQVLRTVLGQAGIALQAQRHQEAAQLSAAAQNLETSRANILQNLFPNLSNVQLNTLKGTQSVLDQSNSMIPNAGLGGSDIANIWLARVGATNQLAQSAADAASRGAIAQGQMWGNALGGATAAVGNAASPLISGWFGGGGGGGGTSIMSDTSGSFPSGSEAISSWG